jgi:hypothetical protein
MVVSERPDSRLPRAIVFHDSFGIALVPYLAESFGRVLFVPSSRFDPDLVLRERADVVIQEEAERYLAKAGQ